MHQMTKLEFTFTPAGTPTDHDPSGDSAYMTWRAVIANKPFTGKEPAPLGKKNDLQPHEWGIAIAAAMVLINAIRNKTPEQLEQDVKDAVRLRAIVTPSP
jgi:hypothetical protein